ncbi:MAG: GTPase Era [Maricaulis sp.]|uniref:GTPase Era n=1 Tax=Maricaulis sp. TaxID=1486257 RepID=UPI001B06130A|nr:GTPase Era [Maricaulis sp.]MBO6729470.1 GTPase Era [Maricaulis sp.]MBO6846389.1 GTPase Era [Maricaulis sp.]MBO6876620.1 GTPase Era [Maricaulis sp.]
MSADTPLRCGFVAVVGSPNAGKSTLVNALVGEKVTIVTHKVQTTRFAVRGVAIDGPSQIVLVDTPGVFAPKRRLDKAMVNAAWAGVADADAVIHVVDASARDRMARGESKSGDSKMIEDDERVTEGLQRTGGKAILALNKIDLLERDRLLAISQNLFETGCYSDVFMVSAKRGYGVDTLKTHLSDLMPEGVWHYPEDQVADLPSRILAAEITREKVYLRLHEELPYASMVDTEVWKRLRDGSIRVEQSIIIERDSQKPIVIGKGGSALKAIGEASRKELEEVLGCKVHLFLNVKVDPKWMNRRGHYSDVGLDFDV